MRKPIKVRIWSGSGSLCHRNLRSSASVARVKIREKIDPVIYEDPFRARGCVASDKARRSTRSEPAEAPVPVAAGPAVTHDRCTLPIKAGGDEFRMNLPAWKPV